jgi:hypothetical protein
MPYANNISFVQNEIVDDHSPFFPDEKPLILHDLLSYGHYFHQLSTNHLKRPSGPNGTIYLSSVGFQSNEEGRTFALNFTKNFDAVVSKFPDWEFALHPAIKPEGVIFEIFGTKSLKPGQTSQQMLLILLKRVSGSADAEVLNREEFQAWLKSKEADTDPTNDMD